MAGDFELKQPVFFECAAADVVDDPRDACVGFLVADDHDVGQVRWDYAGDDVTGEEFGGGFFSGECKLIALALEPRLQIWNAAVVDVAVRLGEAPVFRIGGEIRPHVLVDELLEIGGEADAQRSDHDVRADSAVGWDVAVREIECGVAWVVAEGDTDLFAGGSDDLPAGLSAERQESGEE